MDDLSGCKVIHIDSRKRIALQCVDLLLRNATPSQRRRIASRILAHVRRRAFKEGSQAPQADTRVAGGFAPHPRKLRPRPRRSLRSAPVRQFLCWEINLSCGLANDEDKGFKRHDPMCAARPLRTPFVEEGIRLVESMHEEDTDGKDRG